MGHLLKKAGVQGVQTRTCDEVQMNRPVRLLIRRSLFLVYAILLTTLLLIRKPQELLGIEHVFWGELTHLLTFLVLAVLTMAARWPVSARGVVLCLVAYATATELLQDLLPWRSAEWEDWLQDLAGIAIGTVIWWIVATAGRRSEPAP